MADISHLGNLHSAAPIDLDMYPAAATSTFQLPKAGRYTLRAPESFPTEAFGETKSGFLSARIDPTIVGPSNEGFTIRFVKVSAKSWTDKKSGKEISQLGQDLKATGLTGEVPGEPQAQADAVEQTAGRIYEANLDWRVYNTSTGFNLEGMRNFPKNSDGTYQSWVVDPDDKDEEGNAKRLRANLFVRGFITQD